MRRFLGAAFARTVVVAATLVLAACQAENGDLNERIAALDREVNEIRTTMQANHERILKEFRKVRGAQGTMIRRGLTVAPPVEGRKGRKAPAAAR